MDWRFSTFLLVLFALLIGFSVAPINETLCSSEYVHGVLRDHTKDGALNCFDFWLNRYQTLLGAGVALFAGWLALVGARGQIRVASQQLPFLNQQVIAIRADQISKILSVTEELTSAITNLSDELFHISGRINSIFREAQPDLVNVEVYIRWSQVVDKQEIQEELDDIWTKIELSRSMLALLRVRRSAAQINPNLMIAFGCCDSLYNTFQIMEVRALRIQRFLDRNSKSARADDKELAFTYYDWRLVQDIINKSDRETTHSAMFLREKLAETTKQILSS